MTHHQHQVYFSSKSFTFKCSHRLVFRNGTSANRFNSKMVELLASSPSPSPTVNQENDSTLTSMKSTADDSGISTSSEMIPIDSSRMQSKLLHRRIATMLDTLRRRSGAASPPSASPRLTSTYSDSKSQPITFGQLRQANSNSSEMPPPIPPRSPVTQNVRSSKTATAHSYTDLLAMNPAERQSYHQSNASSATETIGEQMNTSLTVDEILANYYAKVKISTQSSSTNFTSSNNNVNSSFYIHPPTTTSALNPSSFFLNNQNRVRPPPPSYSISVANGHRPPPPPPAQHVFRSPPIQTSVHEPAHPLTHLLPTNSYLSPSSRPPPPHYESSASNIERPPSDLSSANRSKPPEPGFDREFSRLLYGREGRRNRHQRQKRKAFSDPVK